MNIYLLRHAIALPRGTPGIADRDRPLTDDGRKKMHQEAKGIRQVIKNIDIILTSPYIRAYDTAMIAAKALGASTRMEIFTPLQPGTPYTSFMKALKEHAKNDDIMLVGHEPDMSSIASALIGSSEPVIEFKKGSVCCIALDQIPPVQPGILLWLLKPSHLRALGQPDR